MNVLLIAGSWSDEREVSLNGSRAVASALERLGHTVTLYDPEFSFDGIFSAAQGQDFAFINLHGSPGEDGLVQAMLEHIDLPYQGSGPAASFLALNKAAAKAIFKASGLSTPTWILLTARPKPAWRPPFPYPIFVKGNTGGSSLGLERIATPEEQESAFDRLFSKGKEFIVEPACAGIEVSCGVLGKLIEDNGKVYEKAEALPPILITPKTEGSTFFDYTCKYKPGAAEEVCPAPLDAKLNSKIMHCALQAHIALGLRGYSRSDFIIQADGTPMLLEANTLPGMTTTSLLPQEAAATGLSFDALISRLLELGLAAAGK